MWLLGGARSWRSALVTFGVGGAVLLTPATAGADPTVNLQNGNFGTINTGTDFADTYLPVDAGDSSTIANWTVSRLRICMAAAAAAVWTSCQTATGRPRTGATPSTWRAATGDPGGIYQNVATTPYEEYSLSFYSAVNGDDPSDTLHTMGVSVNGTTVGTRRCRRQHRVRASLDWVPNTFTFFADSSGTSRIEFDDTTAGDTDYGPVLDDVSLSVVPDVITASPEAPIAPQTFQTSFTVPLATFTDSYPSITPASFFTASINWGDGSSATSGAVSQSGSTYTVNGTHTYAADGTYTVGVTITSLAGASASISPPDSIQVANAVAGCTPPNCNTSETQNNENSQVNTSGTGTGYLLLSTVPDSGANTTNCSNDYFRHAPNV